MKHLSLVWHGDLDLQKAFWEWAVLGGLIVNIVSSLMFLYLVLNGNVIAAIIVGYGFSVPYNFMVTVGVWRSAERYTGEKRWAELAKIATLIGMMLLSIT